MNKPWKSKNSYVILAIILLSACASTPDMTLFDKIKNSNHDEVIAFINKYPSSLNPPFKYSGGLDPTAVIENKKTLAAVLGGRYQLIDRKNRIQLLLIGFSGICKPSLVEYILSFDHIDVNKRLGPVNGKKAESALHKAYSYAGFMQSSIDVGRPLRDSTNIIKNCNRTITVLIQNGADEDLISETSGRTPMEDFIHHLDFYPSIERQIAIQQARKIRQKENLMFQQEDMKELVGSNMRQQENKTDWIGFALDIIAGVAQGVNEFSRQENIQKVQRSMQNTGSQSHAQSAEGQKKETRKNSHISNKQSTVVKTEVDTYAGEKNNSSYIDAHEGSKNDGPIYSTVSKLRVSNRYGFGELEIARDMLKTAVENSLSEICRNKYRGHLEYATIKYEIFAEGGENERIESRRYKLSAEGPRAQCRHRDFSNQK